MYCFNFNSRKSIILDISELIIAKEINEAESWTSFIFLFVNLIMN